MLCTSLAVLLTACGGGSGTDTSQTELLKSGSANQNSNGGPTTTTASTTTTSTTTTSTYNYYVATTGSDSNPGTQAAPFKTILKASQVAVPDTTIHVSPGTYTGNFQTTTSGTANARIRYISDTRWGAKIVPPASSSSYFGVIFYNSGSYVTIDGFEIDASNSDTSYRNGIYTDGSNVVIQNNHIHNIGTSNPCSGSGGSGINTDHNKNGVNDDVIGNHVHDIGPAGCSAFYHGIYLSTSGNVKNNLVYKATGGGIQTWHDATLINIVNNTLFNNGYGIIVGSGDFYQQPAAPGDYINVHNNIVFDNNIQGISEQGTTGIHNTYVNNLVYQNGTNWQHHNGTTDTGTVVTNPQFVNYIRAGGGNYRLSSTSGAIDKGSPTYAPPTDIDGNIRPAGEAVEIGAYKY